MRSGLHGDKNVEVRAREAASFKCHEAPLGPGPHQSPERAPRGVAPAAEGTRGRGPQKSFTFRPQLATGRCVVRWPCHGHGPGRKAGLPGVPGQN